MPIDIKENESPSMLASHRVEQDIIDRQMWADDWRAIERIRLGQRPKNSLYPNAPNWIDPIVDVNVARVTEIEHTALFTPRYLAHFIPLSPQGQQFKRHLEMAFDHLLKITLRVGTTLNTLLDTKNQGGMAIAKQVMDHDSYNRVFGQQISVPTFVQIHPLDVIVPAETRQIQDATRITDVTRYPVQAFMVEAERNDWENVPQLLEALGIQKGITMPDSGGSTYNHELYRSKLILSETDDKNTVVTVAVYETYYIDHNGRKQVVIYCPDQPHITLKQFSHTWATGPQQGNDKRWKHEQFRYEDRNDYFIDTRGIGQLLKDNQQAASQFLNVKGYHYDLTAYPMFTNDGSATNVAKFRPGPGKVLPKGIDFAKRPPVDPAFNNDADIERARAAQRVGSTIGSESSVNASRDRKTAAEVKSEASNSAVMSSGSLMRFTRPLSSIYTNMWMELQANPQAMPIITDGGEFQGMLPEEVFQMPFLVLSSANSRNASPDAMNEQILPLLQLLPNFETVDPAPIVKRFITNLDPTMADEAVAEEGSEAPITQKVQQIIEAIEQLSTENESIAERVTVLMELAEVNIHTDQEQDEEIKKLEQARTEVQKLIKDEVEKLQPKEDKK